MKLFTFAYSIAATLLAGSVGCGEVNSVSTSWNADQTELTISPDARLVYAEVAGRI